jgi:hypothetical protein
MKMMAIGEIGALLLSIVSAVWVAAALDDEPMLVRVVGSLVAMYLVAKVAFRFVHLGYRPEGNKT